MTITALVDGRNELLMADNALCVFELARRVAYISLILSLFLSLSLNFSQCPSLYLFFFPHIFHSQVSVSLSHSHSFSLYCVAHKTWLRRGLLQWKHHSRHLSQESLWRTLRKVELSWCHAIDESNMSIDHDHEQFRLLFGTPESATKNRQLGC